MQMLSLVILMKTLLFLYFHQFTPRKCFYLFWCWSLRCCLSELKCSTRTYDQKYSSASRKTPRHQVSFTQNLTRVTKPQSTVEMPAIENLYLAYCRLIIAQCRFFGICSLLYFENSLRFLELNSVVNLQSYDYILPQIYVGQRTWKMQCIYCTTCTSGLLMLLGEPQQRSIILSTQYSIEEPKVIAVTCRERLYKFNKIHHLGYLLQPD